ncbi:MAG: cation-transporting P-type ATPase [Deltaproteobacteria bacterium]|nr:cation-transporting P-type ATPase [Deltaproteobacteria bacterium]MBZ0219771.1 cation-transporting P-type ATPase [Deltaproteobacteria bacterium]
MKERLAEVKWHSLGVKEAMEALDSGPKGLTASEAARRLKEFGPNRLTPQRKRGPLARFLSQFHNVLIYVLLIAAVITALLDHWVDSGVILGVVIVNALIGFIQEGKAEKALDAIKKMLSLNALVLRDNVKTTVPAEELVPGDIVFLQSGDKVPADLRLVSVKSLRIDEAALTGESVPVEKAAEPAPEHATIGDRNSLAFSGTLVTYGQASGVVVATGDSTEIGRISSLLSEVEPLTTRLLLSMSQFGRWLSAAIIALAAATFFFGMLVRDYSAGEMFLAGIGLAVAAIPEGLPAIITITLAIGVQRMARRNAIIRRLPAVETLGSVTVVCSDKTGTLTRNEMTVQSVITPGKTFTVSGVGYDPHGGFLLGGKDIVPEEHPGLMEIAKAGLLCNDATLSKDEEEWRVHGDPTEGALVTVALKAGLEHAFINEMFPREDAIPFESEHRFMATLNHDHEGHAFIFLKGAPERVLKMCGSQRTSGGDEEPLDLSYWQGRVAETASRGQRLIAVACKPVSIEVHELSFSDVEGGLTLLGMFGIIDPPRAEAISAVALCKSAGIRVKMITGDHALTARSIGSAIGIGENRQSVTGEEVESMDFASLKEAVVDCDVFARVSPEHKLKLVEALQDNGEVVAMTGDGVNDAPALKRADVGVAMGIKGTEVAKESSEMVLADDNFASISNAVEEGRTVYDNIIKSITFILPTNGGEAGIILAAIFSGMMLPITPVQILWVNMITAVTLALSLAFEPPEADVMRRPPRDPKEPILSAFLIWRVLFVSGIIIIGTFGLFVLERTNGTPIEEARTVAVNTLVMFEVFYLLNTRYLRRSVVSFEGLFGNRYALIAIALVVFFQLLFTYVPFLQSLFGTADIGVSDWLRIVAVAFTVFVLVEIEKFLIDRNSQRTTGVWHGRHGS